MIQGNELDAGIQNKKSRTHKKLKSSCYPPIRNLSNNDPVFSPLMPVAPNYGAGQSTAWNQADNNDDILPGAVISKVNQMLSSSSSGKQLQHNAWLI